MTPLFTLLHASNAQRNATVFPAVSSLGGTAAHPLVQNPDTQPTAVPDVCVAQKDPSEHRVAKRHKVLKAAKIVLDDWRSMDCQVRDISDTGAKIRISGTASLPHKFQLLIMADNTIRPVQVAWMLNDMIGVAFRGQATRAPARKLVTGMC